MLQVTNNCYPNEIINKTEFIQIIILDKYLPKTIRIRSNSAFNLNNSYWKLQSLSLKSIIRRVWP